MGSGNGGALRFVFSLVLALLFAFVLAFAFTFGAGLRSSIGSVGTSAFAFGLAFTFAGRATVPPAGIPSSLFPVGEAPGCTG